MSTPAPSWQLADCPCNTSPYRGCNPGSVHTLWHTSFMRSTAKSLSSLCHNVGIPPVGQVRACSTVRFLPHMHVFGRMDRCHPYRRATASRKAPLCKKNKLVNGQNTYSQLEAPLSIASCMLSEAWYRMVSVFSCTSFLFMLLRPFLASICPLTSSTVQRQHG